MDYNNLLLDNNNNNNLLPDNKRGYNNLWQSLIVITYKLHYKSRYNINAGYYLQLL